MSFKKVRELLTEDGGSNRIKTGAYGTAALLSGALALHQYMEGEPNLGDYAAEAALTMAGISTGLGLKAHYSSIVEDLRETDRLESYTEEISDSHSDLTTEIYETDYSFSDD